jgi:hypothetical protein
MTKAKKKPQRVTVNLSGKPRKKTVPKTAYSKEHLSPFAWKPGECGHYAGGRQHSETRLLSKSMNVYLADKAPEEVSRGCGLPANGPKGSLNYSWAQCLARRILVAAIKLEPWAIDQVVRLTEPQRARLDVFGGGLSGEAEDAPPLIQLVWVESDGDGHPKYNTIDGMPPALPAATD